MKLEIKTSLQIILSEFVSFCVCDSYLLNLIQRCPGHKYDFFAFQVVDYLYFEIKPRTLYTFAYEITIQNLRCILLRNLI